MNRQISRPDVLFFDAGNTLVYLDHPFLRSLCKQRGVATTDRDLLLAEYVAKEEVDNLFRSGRRTTDAERWHLYFRSILAQVGVRSEELAEYIAPLSARHQQLNLWSRLLEGTAEMLASLGASGYRLAVISNSDGRIRTLLETVGIAGHFEEIIDSGVVGVEKPDPEIFAIGCERMGVSSGRALYIGDMYEIDIVGARSAGMPALLIDPLDRWRSADCPRLTSLLDLPAYLLAGDAR
jgi:putative hydrolase of the HAD superfamily